MWWLQILTFKLVRIVQTLIWLLYCNSTCCTVLLKDNNKTNNKKLLKSLLQYFSFSAFFLLFSWHAAAHDSDLKLTLWSNNNMIIVNLLFKYMTRGMDSVTMCFSLIWKNSSIANIPTPIHLCAGADCAHWRGSAPLVIQLVLISNRDKARQIEFRLLQSAPDRESVGSTSSVATSLSCQADTQHVESLS